MMPSSNSDQSLPNSLPIEIIGHILSYVKADARFFWNYGLVCKTFLKEVTKIMKQNGMIIELKGNDEFDMHLKMIFNDNEIASAISDVGLDLSNNKLANDDHYKQLLNHCRNIRKLNLSFCELKNEVLYDLAGLSMLEILNLSGSEALNDENLACFVKRNSKLTNLDLLMCEKITDLGKLKYAKNPECAHLDYDFGYNPYDTNKQFKFSFRCEIDSSEL